MLINLLDSNFSGQSCSVAHQQSQYIQYVRGLRNFDGVTLFTDEWINNPIVDQIQSRYKIGWLHEPYTLHPLTYDRAWRNRHKFDIILTYHQEFIDIEPDKFKYCIYGGTWIDKAQWGIKPKGKLCSTIVGAKLTTDGHRIRHEIADLIEAEHYPVDIYGVRGEPIPYGQEAKMKVLSDYAFCIVTETGSEVGLFTEWILDCFALGTIPIFWGCPNIGDFFNLKGILRFDTVERLQKILPVLSFESWRSQLAAIYINLIKMAEYAVTEDWLYRNVLWEYEK